jgi:ABC-2 type transport system permease protein
VGFLLVVIVALFCGDTVASEASWGSLRYLLAIPVPRTRLLRQKLIVALCLSFGANLLLPAWSYLVGGVFFGWAPGQSPLGGTFTTVAALQRLLIVVCYVSIQSLLVAALAFLLSVLTDAPLGAVGGATMLVVVSNILDSIDDLDPYRRFLPTHFQFSWLDSLGQNVIWDDMVRGTGLVSGLLRGVLRPCLVAVSGEGHPQLDLWGGNRAPTRQCHPTPMTGRSQPASPRRS